jgi:hypothetical protein
MKPIELFGWYGALAILAAYALSSFAVLSPADLSYQLLNLTGAIGIATVSFHKRTYQPGVLNMVWAAIAFIALIGILS